MTACNKQIILINRSLCPGCPNGNW